MSMVSWPFIRGSFTATHHGLALRVKHLFASKHRQIFGERVRWTRNEFEGFQRNQLERVIRQAVTNVPWYRRECDSYLKNGLPRPLHELPTLDKQTVRGDVSLFYADKVVGGVRRHTTSGTTGSPLSIRFSYSTHSLFQAGLERHRETYGFRECERMAALTGFFRPGGDNLDQFWWRDYLGNRMFLSPYHCKDDMARSYYQVLRDFRPVGLFGYASSVYLLASLLERNNLLGPDSLKVALTTSEVLYPAWRDCIERTFRVPVADQYGSQEGQCLVTECSNRRMHINPEHGIVEVVDDDGMPTSPGVDGQILLTGLVNDAMPLIRYRIGDRATVDAFGDRCECGLAWPAISTIGGRSEDTIWTPDGRPLMYLNFHSTKNVSGIIESQFIQDAPDHLRILLVVDKTFGHAQQELIEAEICRRSQFAFRFTVEYLDFIPRGARGKFKAVVSHIGPATSNARAS